MNFDTADSNIILISYPSGGFGNFLYHALTEFANNTVKVINDKFEFSNDGNSHNTKKYTAVYYHDPESYSSCIYQDSDNRRIVVLCDNGINNDSYAKINRVFPNAAIVRAVITDAVRPVIYKTAVIKAMSSDLITENQDRVNANWTDSDEDYAVRENFTLLYHNWPFNWQPSTQTNVINVDLDKLIINPTNTITELINQLGMSVINLDGLIKFCCSWLSANQTYFDIFFKWKNIERALDYSDSIDLSDITELHDQGYINYGVEHKYGITIPVYTYRDWFKNTEELKRASISQL
jgi:hypothetical protein